MNGFGELPGEIYSNAPGLTIHGQIMGEKVKSLLLRTIIAFHNVYRRMDTEITALAQYLVLKLESDSERRILVGIAGIPASGKSTFACLLTERINAILDERKLSLTALKGGEKSSQHLQAILVGLDGWHHTRAQLDLFPDPKLAHDRRGTHWTFDGPGYVTFVEKLRNETKGDIELITAPSFDHALKDPTPDAVVIHPYHRIVLIEGLYVFLAVEPWSQAGMMLDERWYIEVDSDEAKRRLVGRHVLTGVAKDVEEAEWRANENDIPNGHFIVANLLEPTRVIQSENDPSFEHLPTLSDPPPPL